MDPVSLILTALAAGAAASVQATTTDAVKDAYNGLKTLLRRKFAGKPKAEVVLAEHEDDPETYEKPLRKVLVQEHIDADTEIVEEAQKLMSLIQPQQVSLGKFNIHIAGDVQGFQQGDHAEQTNYFGDVSKEH